MKFVESKTNERNGYNLIVTKIELLKIIDDFNVDESIENRKYIDDMIKMINYVTDKKWKFSDKQRQWVLSKIRFVILHNKDFNKMIRENYIKVKGKINIIDFNIIEKRNNVVGENYEGK
jgi:predicted lipase